MAADLAGRITTVDDFSVVVREHDRALRALAFRLLGDHEMMDDALQDAYSKALRAYGSFRGDSAVGTWLYRIVYNSCIDAQRVATKHRHANLDSVPAPAIEDHPSDEAQHDLAAALAALPSDQRAVVLLVDAHGFDYGEASAVLGVPVGTIASRLSRARHALRRHLKGTR